MAVTLNASTSSGLIATSDTSGNIELQSNGTTKATVSSSGLAIGQYNPSTSLITSGTAVASTSGTSIDFTSIPSWVKRITVMLQAVSTNGTSVPLIQVGAGSVTTSGYVCAVTNIQGSSAYSAFPTTGFGLVVSSNYVASSGLMGSLVLTLQTSNTWIASGTIARSDAGTTGGTVTGYIALGGALDRVRVTTTNGTDTFDAGTINILYE